MLRSGRRRLPRLLPRGERCRHRGPVAGGAEAVRAGARGAVLVAGMRHVPRGGGDRDEAGEGGRGAGRARRGARVPRRVLGPRRVEGPLRVQHVDGAAEGVRRVAEARHALHASGGCAREDRARGERGGEDRRRGQGRAEVPLAYHEGNIQQAITLHPPSLLLRRPPQQGRQQRGGCDGGTVRERTRHRLHQGREQGQGALQRLRRPPSRESGVRQGRRPEEEPHGHRHLRALGRVQRGQVRPPPLRPERIVSYVWDAAVPDTGHCLIGCSVKGLIGVGLLGLDYVESCMLICLVFVLFLLCHVFSLYFASLDAILGFS
ncbi:uncharacterized protein M6B38_218615 [Iris pallida]|uniref:Uncharacterized protein n=1 Tax=Iris pallida TaxID=29817 RepID=A0AAX6DXD2_IRIPA|nr:uncharacterized protein M6B38_218615 [Iris pallida]